MAMRLTVSLATLDALLIPRCLTLVGAKAGRYPKLGVTPGYAAPRATISVSSARSESASRTERKAGPVLDVIFVATTLAFFVLSIGYVAVCDRLMK